MKSTGFIVNAEYSDCSQTNSDVTPCTLEVIDARTCWKVTVPGDWIVLLNDPDNGYCLCFDSQNLDALLEALQEIRGRYPDDEDKEDEEYHVTRDAEPKTDRQDL